MFAHINGTELTAALALLKYMPFFLMLHTARFDIFANVTTISATNGRKTNYLCLTTSLSSGH